ncbi:hypothetical protein, partial [Asanoa sp. NPDC050611]|uniref:hypothetical protein n=1 Tax=Asanoa sp. NPDC050611 TaxID=3157098 RepID=UPI00340B2C0B
RCGGLGGGNRSDPGRGVHRRVGERVRVGVAELVARADLAMYEAKHRGTGGYAIYRDAVPSD